MSNEQERLQELRQKEMLNDAEMRELVRLCPPGMFQLLPNLLTMGVVDLKQHHENMLDGPRRSQVARKNGCYMEVLSLRLQHMDLWLRMFWVARNGLGKIFEPDDKRTFGTLIADCERLGFDAGLVKRMRDFNEVRIQAIHKYLLGATTYEALEAACLSCDGLDAEVREYVLPRVGKPWVL